MDIDDASKMILAEAREAWEWHARGMGWLKWIAVGRGLQECQRLALTSTHSNDMTSHAARLAMREILRREGLDRIDKGDRSVLLQVIENLPAITAWMDTLSLTERIRYNHPRAVWGRFQRATIVPKPVAVDQEKPPSLKTLLAAEQAQNSVLKQRLKTEGSLFNLHEDTVENIARAICANVALGRAEQIARAVLSLVKKRRSEAGHAG